MLQATSNWLAANRHFEKVLIHRIVITGYYRSFSNDNNQMIDDPWLLSIDEQHKNINDLQGGADKETFAFTLQDHRNLITADMASFTFEGCKVQYYIGINYPGHTMALGDYLLYWQGYIDDVASANSNTEYHFTCSDVTSKLEQVVYLAGDNGGQTSGSNIRTLVGHPLQMMLDILLSELRDPKSGQALDPTLVDVSRIQKYRDGPFAGMEFEFHLQQPPQALEFIKNQILKPLGGYLWVTQGKLTVNFFYPITAPVPVQTIGPDDWLSIPTAEQTQMMNTVQWQFDKDDGVGASSGSYLSTNTQQYAPSVAKYGLYGEHKVDADGLRAGLQGYLISWLVSWLIFGRYGFKNLTFESNAAEGIMSLWLLEPGDIVGVTHTQIPNRKAGVMGLTNYPFEVMNKQGNPFEGKVTLTMLDASYLYNFGFAEVAPDAEGNYTAVSAGDKAQFMFQSGSNAKYSNGDKGNLLG
jgi:hypothetical protein